MVMTMIKRIRSAAWLLLFIICAFPLSAEDTGLPSEAEFVPIVIGAEAFWYGSIPSKFHEDQLAIRSHLGTLTTFLPLKIQFNENISLASGLTAGYVSQSLAYGFTIWRPFWMIGPTFELSFLIDERWRWGTGISLLGNWYHKAGGLNLMTRISVFTEYRIIEVTDRKTWLSLIIPLHFDIRKDYASVSTGVGARLNLLVRASKEKP